MRKIANINATPNTGWEFINWTEDGNVISTESEFQYEVTKDTTLIANFQKKTLLLTIGSLGFGSVSGGGSYLYGDNVTVTATPDEGHKFIGWYIGDSLISNDNIFTFVIDENLELTAKFEEITYTLILQANPEDGGIVNGGGIY